MVILYFPVGLPAGIENSFEKLLPVL